MSAFGDRRLDLSAAAALLSANLRYWPTVAPLVKTQLRRWESQAQQIENPTLNALATSKLRDEHFNAQVAATLATTVPRQHRSAVIEAIVAYEVIYDYLDGLTEQPYIPTLRHAQHAYSAFTDAITPTSPHTPPTATSPDYYADLQLTDNGYLTKLVTATQNALINLPSWPAVAEVALAAADRCSQAQARAHTTTPASLEQWARSQAANTELGWREYLAGAASSVLAIHALIAAAAEPRTTTSHAHTLDSAYLSICALSTLLDGLIDHDRDTQETQTGYLHHYKDHQQIADSLATAAEHAIDHARRLPRPGHHLMTLTGVAAYYTSAPTARSEMGAAITHNLRQKLQPLITPTLLLMRAWRAAKRIG